MAEVEIYTKDLCAYCEHAKQLLQQKGVDFTEIRVDLDADKLKQMLARSSGARTLPQIFINGEHVGGFKELQALEHEGTLDQLLKD